jgi:hypothetical protein
MVISDLLRKEQEYTMDKNDFISYFRREWFTKRILKKSEDSQPISCDVSVSPNPLTNTILDCYMTKPPSYPK